MNTFNLTEDQIKSLGVLNSTPSGFIVLNGSAGTGKTTLVSHYLSSKGGRVRLTAPTHKAVAVLEGKNPGYVCQTIHSFLGLKPKLIGNKYQFIQQNINLLSVDILIIDEASMIDRELLQYIINYSEQNPKCLVIFIGDNKQLNPIGEVNSPIFEMGYITTTLEQIVRHDNDIIDLSQNLSWLKERREGDHFTWAFKENIQLLIDSNGTDKAKFITWTNESVSIMNQWVRSKIHETKNLLQFYPGEVILITEPYEQDNELIYKNNEEVVINKITAGEKYGFKTYRINGVFDVVQESDLSKWNQFLLDLKEACEVKKIAWSDYYAFKESFGQYQFNHAITVHRSQGSTYRDSFINISEIMKNPSIRERNRMLYTAITRASNKNYLT